MPGHQQSEVSIPHVNLVTHFYVSEFQSIIDEMMKVPDPFYRFTIVENRRWPYKFLWLEIACIDQCQKKTPSVICK